jgi:hypothetical protein
MVLFGKKIPAAEQERDLHDGRFTYAGAVTYVHTTTRQGGLPRAPRRK